MRILLIHNFYQYWGGEDTYVTSLKKLLEENGHEVYLYSKDSKNIKTAWDKIKTAVGLFYNPWVKKELTKIIKEFKPDAAHFHNVYPLICATSYRICKQYNVPIVQHIHNYRFMCPKGILFRNGKICELCLHKKFPFYSIVFGCYHRSQLTSLFFSLAFYYHRQIKTFDFIDKFIFPSEFTRVYYLKYLNIPNKKTIHLPHFIDTDIKKLKTIRKENFFLFVGRLSEEKGIIELLEIFKSVPKIKLVVIGDGPLREKVNGYKKYKNIKILGFLNKEEIYQHMRRSKAVVIPSTWYEVLPIVYIESLVSGTPVFIPGNKNFNKIINESNGLHKYQTADFSDLKFRIISFNKENKKAMVNSMFRNYKLKYSKEKHMKKLIEQYLQIIKL